MANVKPILFCDFDGVLCYDRYWRSVPVDKWKAIQELLFLNDTSLVNDWMRGKYTSEEINQFVSEKIDMPFNELWNIFINDCKNMKVSLKALEKLYQLRSKYTVILITGNMDSFTRFTHPELMLDNYFDYISNSYYEGMHKSDNNGELFLKYASKYNVVIENCLLFDDSIKNGDIFSNLGGTAYLVTPEKDIIFHLDNLIDSENK